jgi:tetratricopeptide (TPR) repeat protein/peroxiredoxin
MTSYLQTNRRSLSRRAILKGLSFAPLLFRPAPLRGLALLAPRDSQPDFSYADVRLTPHYPSPNPLAPILALVNPGSDSYVTEKYAVEIEALLRRWAASLRSSPTDHSVLLPSLDPELRGASLASPKQTTLRSAFGLTVQSRTFPDSISGSHAFAVQLAAWLGPLARVETAEFEIYSLTQTGDTPLRLEADIRYDLVAERSTGEREERVGSWHTEWTRNGESWIVHRWDAREEKLCVLSGPPFADITETALGHIPSFRDQLLHGADYWRTILDGAIGVDVYGNNGIAAGDIDNDGFDDLYICQAAGLPNRLYRNRGDGTFEDVTEKAGVGILDSTACALFADLRNSGHQDLLVVCGTGPLLFLNQGDGTFVLKHDAFQFARPPQGSFTHAAIADYDRDGKLDIYFCLYMYYLGLDQYHYPIPYYDARNGPPNCLFHNRGDGTFVEVTEAAGLNADNNRYSFASAWGDSNGNGLPDLFVANDFGSSQLYRNQGNGTFKVVSKEAGVESVGAGMSCCWCDYDNDGHQDIYVPSMWEAAGQRVSQQKQFHPDAPASIREKYQRHARGNALYRNQGNGTFQNAGAQAHVEMGRWSWSSDFWDFDHDGYPDLYVANGYLTEPGQNDLAGFFWRQVVAKSTEDETPSLAYEHGWNAINELIRSDNTWHGLARNVFFLNNHDGTFTEASGALAMDFLEDSRAFALADIDHDGRLEVILKNRNAPQIRILRNALAAIGRSISFRLRGTTSNRDAIGASVTLESNGLRQTRYLQAGSGFLSQHSKELFFGIGDFKGPIRAVVRWPSGSTQTFDNLPSDHQVTIQEGSSTFTAKAFPSVSAAQTTAATRAPEPLPQQVETWLIQPLKAPDFTLADATGTRRSLNSFRDKPALFTFWSRKATVSTDALALIQRHCATGELGNLHIVAVNLDEAADQQSARAFAVQQNFSFPVLFADNDTAGIYNLIYRYLYDRRRDLPVPISFLLDSDGMIVKVIQGPVDPLRAAADSRSIPATAADRSQRALPFPGKLVQGAFARNDFTYGVAMFQHGYLDQAAASFQQVIAAKPDNADAYYNLGTLNLRRNNFDEARRCLEQTLKLRPDYPEAWNNLGMMAAQQGRPDEAIQNFEQSLALRPGYAIALLNLGNVYRRQRDYNKALDCLTRALALQPDDPEINYSMGMLYAQQNQVEPASRYLHRALELRSDYPEALNNLGVLLVRQQDYTQAEDQFKSGIRVAPNYDQSYLNLARLYALQNDRQKARDILTQLLRLQPENAGAKQAMEMLQ